MVEPIYDGCVCSDTTLRFNYCKCGARQKVLEARANEIAPTLNEEQVEAMVTLDGAVPLRKANHLGYRLRKLGLLTNIYRSGDNAEVMTDLGKEVQKTLRQMRDVV